MSRSQYKARALQRRAEIRKLCGVMTAEQVCQKFKLRPRWKVAPKTWGMR